MFYRALTYVCALGLSFSSPPIKAQTIKVSITKIAGSGRSGFSGDDNDARAASFGSYTPLAIGKDDVLYLADEDNNRIRAINLKSNTIHTIAGNGSTTFRADPSEGATSSGLNRPSGIAIDSAGNVYISDTNNCAIRKISMGRVPVISSIGGSACGTDDKTTVSAHLRNPFGLTFSKDGTLYVADAGNSRIRKIHLGADTEIETIALVDMRSSGPSAGNSSDEPRLIFPWYMAFDPVGKLYASDVFNHRIYRISLGERPAITTVVGNGNAGCNGDGGDPTQASVSPGQIAFDAAGQLFIADANVRIRKVTFGTRPVITTVIGSTDTAGAPIGPELDCLSGLAIDLDGNLYYSANAQIFKAVGIAASAFATRVSVSAGIAELGDQVTLHVSGARNAPALVSDNGKALSPEQKFTTDEFGKILIPVKLPLGVHAISAVIGSSISPSVTLTVTKHRQTLSFEPVTVPTVSEVPITLVATASSGLPVVFSAEGACVVAGTMFRRADADSGPCTVTARQPGDDLYAPAEPVSQTMSFPRVKQSQTILFTATPSHLSSGSSIALSASATSGLPVSFAATGSCTFSGAKLKIAAAGSCSVTANQAGDETYAPATPVMRTITVSKAIQMISLSVSATQVTYPGVVSVTVDVPQNSGPDAMVEIYDSAKMLTSVRPQMARAYWLIEGLAVGSHNIFAILRREKNILARTSPVTVSVSQAPVTLRAVCSSVAADSVLCSVSAVSTFGPAAGFVVYRLDRGRPVTVRVFGGIAEIKLTLGKGSHSLTLQFPKQGGFAASQSLVTPIP